MADSQGPLAKVPEERKRQWYNEALPDLSKETRDVLEKYSKIPPNELEAHLKYIVGLYAYAVLERSN